MNLATALAIADAELRRGQSAESLGTPAALAEAVVAYDRARAFLTPATADIEHRRLLAVICMNRGNALQKQSARAAAVAAYDEAIALLRTLPFADQPALRNHLGAAWLNRGHALRSTIEPADIAAALHSLREAIALLSLLPLHTDPSYRANLAGAWLNLADTLTVSDEPQRFEAACDAARRALALTAAEEEIAPGFAHLGLMARRAHVMALGHLLTSNSADALIAETSDSLDSGLALARRWEAAGVALRPFAVRLLFFGGEFYRRHQPQFLGEFLLENLDPDRGAPAHWTADAELRTIAIDALDRARNDLLQPRMLIAGDAVIERLLATRASVTDAAERLATLGSTNFNQPSTTAP